MAAQPDTIEAQAVSAPSQRPATRAEGAAVTCRGVTKAFRISQHGMSTLKERVLHPFSVTEHETLEALRDVSFEIRRGEFFGIIGRNGSGKSTLLKCLAGIYQPDEGSIDVRGRLSPFIELGVGFNPDLNAPDNVMVNATLMGLTPREARRRFPEVIRFAELEDFVDMKLKNYSSGMQVRLGFATAIQVDADLLLVDEVLAVGDALFQRKCFDTFRRLKDEGRTIIYVSHDLDTIARFSDRALLIDGGEVIDIDRPEIVIRQYQERNREREEGHRVRAWSGADRVGDGAAEIVDAWFEDAAGARATVLRQGERVALRFVVRFHRDIEEPMFAFNVRNDDQVIVLNVNDRWSGSRQPDARAGEERRFTARFDNWLAHGRHFATPIVSYSDTIRWADLRERFVQVEVEAPRRTGGVVDLPQEIEVQASVDGGP